MAYSSWPEKYRPTVDREAFIKSLIQGTEYIVYGALSVETGKLCGYAFLKEFDEYYSFISLRVIPEIEKLGVNLPLLLDFLRIFQKW